MKNRIRQVLEEKGITQKQLAKEIGMTEVGISKAADGSASMATIKKIADYLEVESTTLIADEPGVKIKYRGELHLGEFAIPCYVLEDGRRVLSGRGMQEALKTVDDNKTASGHRILRYLNQKSLNPFIFRNKEPGHFEPLICYDGGTQINGYEAVVLIDLCDGILEARKHIELSPRQAIIAEQCEILVRSFAKVGLIALIDEATGYDKVKNKAKDNLQKWLNTFLAEEASRWVKTFPDSFFELIYKMYGWTWTNSPKKPGVVGNIINDWVYLRLGPKVLEELDRLNPKNANGRRVHKHHQNLSETIGKPALQRHLEALKALGAASGYDRARFLDMLNRAYPRPNEQFTFDFGEWE